jgi:DNA-binding NtrC family response regulator
MEFLRSRPWAGNVRELQNGVEQLVVLTDPGQVVEPEHIPVYEDRESFGSGQAIGVELLDQPFHTAKDHLVTNFEKEYVTRLVARAAGNMSQAARLARIDRTTLYRLMEKHHFRKDEVPGF